jgi:hypothetical protein
MTEREELVETVEIQTAAVTTPAPLIADRQGNPTGADGSIADLSKVRALVLKAHPDVVPDLIAGGSVDELIASVEPARSAYQRIADQVRGAQPEVGNRKSEEQPPVVPAGGASNVIDPGELAPTSKIAQALAERRGRG